MIPLSDTVVRPRFPWAVTALIAVEAAASIAIFSMNDAGQAETFRALGFSPAHFRGAPWTGFLQLLTATFVHGDWLHLIGNMIFLWVFGRSVAAEIGSPLFLVCFPVLGLPGFLLHWVVNPAGALPVLGASASISALMGLYLVLFPRAHIKLLVILVWFVRMVSVPVWAVLAYWFGLQLLGVLLQDDQVDHIAYAAHVGGLLAGVFAGFVWRSGPGVQRRLEIAATE